MVSKELQLACFIQRCGYFGLGGVFVTATKFAYIQIRFLGQGIDRDRLEVALALEREILD
tara:strand:+ start:17446 stop:17625 length:180 start_codon:yes stop_codon:yes gene_type:complete